MEKTRIDTLHFAIFLLTTLVLLQSCVRSGTLEKNGFVIGFSQCTAGDNWRKVMHAEMFEELANYRNVELIIKDANNNSALQIEQIKQLIAEDIDILIVSPNEVEPITPIVEEIYYKGLPVIIIDRKTNSNLYTAYVGADNDKIGEKVGHYAASLLNYKGSILEIWGLRGSSPAIQRHNGFTRAISNYPEIKVTREVFGQWEKEPTEMALKKSYLENGKVDLVFAHNDRMALGAYTFAQQIGIQDRLKFIGIDGLPGSNRGQQFVADGILNATALYPTGGEEAIKLAMSVLNKEGFEKENLLSTLIIDKENVNVIKSYADRINALSNTNKLQREQLTNLESNLSNYTLLIGISIVLILLIISWIIFNNRGGNNKEERFSTSTRQVNTDVRPIAKESEPITNSTSTGSKDKTILQATTLSQPSSQEVKLNNPRDQEFLEAFHTNIEVNLSDPDFGVNVLCQELGISRVQLYRKIKSLLDTKVSDYIQKVRLDRSKELLEDPNLSVAEVAFRVGFSSPSYFSTAFKSRYQITPSEFKQNANTNENF